jgi:hypothetical protein
MYDLKAASHKAFIEFVGGAGPAWDESEQDVKDLCEAFYKAGYAGGTRDLAQELQDKLGEGKVKEAGR